MLKLEKKMTLEALPGNLPQVLDFLEEALDELDCPLKTRMQIAVAAEEIYVNIASYAYAPGTGTADIRLMAAGEPTTVTISFSDGGKPFDPLQKEDPDITLSAEERDIGGLGIFMTKKIMDEVKYAYRDGKNILTMIKKL